MASRPTVILSGGGIGSTVVASRYRRDGPLRWVFVDYGQPAAEQEHQAVTAIAAEMDARDVTTVRLDTLGALPAGRLGRAATKTAGESGGGRLLHDASNSGLLATLTCVACDCALRFNASAVMLGLYEAAIPKGTSLSDGPAWQAHPREFIHAANILAEATFPLSATPEILAPVVELPAADVARLGRRFDAPLHLTWSCHTGQAAPCGNCSGCSRHDEAVGRLGVETKTAALTP